VLHVRRGVPPIPRDGRTELLELPPKSDRGARSVEIPAAAVAELERYRTAQAERRLVLGEAWAADWHATDVVIDDGLGRPLNPDVLSRRFGRLKARLGVRHEIRFHDFRALYVTEALAAGVDAGTVSRQAGHSTVSFTHDQYQRPRRAEARAVADAIDAALGDALAAASVDLPLTSDGGDVVELRPKGR
jgi:integrase